MIVILFVVGQDMVPVRRARATTMSRRRARGDEDPPDSVVDDHWRARGRGTEQGFICSIESTRRVENE